MRFLDHVTIVGIIAATCTTVSFLPQVIKVYRSKHARDLSLPMYIIFSFGVICWLFYGLLVHSMPIVIANAVTFILCLYILSMKIKYK